MDSLREAPITFTAADGYSLHGIIVTPIQPRGAVLLSSGTGFPMEFYLPMARYFASRGLTTLVYDYRGIGQSAHENLRYSTIEYPDWGRLDMPAAASALAKTTGASRLFHIAHSVAGHFVGLMQNHEVFARHAFIAVGSGYWGHHYRHYVPISMYFWWLYGPSQLWLNGFIAPGGGWRGQALPPKVFKQWRRWCHQPNYFREDMASFLRPHWYNEITVPIRSWVFLDDPITTPVAALNMLENYTRVSPTFTFIRASDIGAQQIGHSGAFREGMLPLWQDIFTWFSGADNE